MHQNRIIKCSEGLDRPVRLLSDKVSLGEGQRESWETLTRVVTFKDPYYGEVKITRAKLNAMVRNFDEGVYGQDIFIDVSHRPDEGSAGQIKQLAVEKNKLRALIEWTDYGIDAVNRRGFRYFSAEFHENYPNPETGKKHGCLLQGAGLTTRPRVKHLDPVNPSRLQLSFDGQEGDVQYIVSPRLVNLLTEEISEMKAKYQKLLAEALNKIQGLTEQVITQLSESFGEALEGVTEEAQAKIMLTAFTNTGEGLAKQLAEAGTSGTIKLDFSGLSQALSGMNTGASLDDLNKLLDERAAQAQADAQAAKQALETNVKLFTDTINAVEGFDDELKKQLSESAADLITGEMTEPQVKAFADNQIAMGKQLSEQAAQARLVSMGMPGAAGSVHISVDDSNSVKALQETVDKRLGIEGMADSRRFAATGGQLLEENKALADKVLAQFDALHAADLRAEHKMLAAGDGVVSDVAVPVSWERTVIREALYQVMALQFVNVGVENFATSYSIPYSYRDSTAAGRSNTRRYEGQSIQRAGVIQTAETAYNIPQKLAFEVSDELRYLTAARHLNWEAVSENQQNASRIISEDTEHLIFNETLNSSDEYSVVVVASEARTADVDGTNNVFPLANFPVVRPRKVFDLQGNQVGATTNAITVTLGGSGINEYDGTGTQAPGNYWTMDYNQGELRVVNETGALQTPTNATALVVAYSYTSNCYNFNTDLGSTTAEDHWDTFIYRYGLRKAAIENERFHMPNYGLMSGTVSAMIEQAKTFAANFRRPGTELAQDGNIGRIKDIPNFKSSAPGLFMGDQRIIIGERGVTRYRMAKPWSMGELENQKDANGRYTGKKEAYGDQFVVLHTPTQLKAALTSINLYSSTGRVARAE